jgi:hypothetical protein
MNISNESTVDINPIMTSSYDDTKDRLMQLSDEDKQRLMSEMTDKPSDTPTTPDTDTSKTVDKSIVLDGPLGHIYTKALDMVYAKEGMMASAPIVDTDITSDVDQGTYVYCCDADEVDSDVAMKAMESFKRAKGLNYCTLILAAEVHKSFIKGSVSLGVLEEYVDSIGGHTYYRRNTALERLRGISYA